jgi:hypothetical protein
LGLKQFADEYDTDADQDYNLLYDLKLPTYDSNQLSVPEFLDTFESFKRSFVYEKYYLLLIPKNKGYRKYSLIGFSSLEEGKNFVIKNISGLIDEYIIKISEFDNNIYGGSIMSNDNIVILEMAPGLQTEIAHGTTNVISGQLTPLSISVKYSTKNEKERKLIWEAMKAVTREQSDGYQTHEIRGIHFLKGYFEFAFTKGSNKCGLRLVFIDVKLKRSYFNITIDCY